MRFADVWRRPLYDLRVMTCAVVGLSLATHMLCPGRGGGRHGGGRECRVRSARGPPGHGSRRAGDCIVCHRRDLRLAPFPWRDFFGRREIEMAGEGDTAMQQSIAKNLSQPWSHGVVAADADAPLGDAPLADRREDPEEAAAARGRYRLQ